MSVVSMGFAGLDMLRGEGESGGGEEMTLGNSWGRMQLKVGGLRGGRGRVVGWRVWVFALSVLGRQVRVGPVMLGWGYPVW